MKTIEKNQIKARRCGKSGCHTISWEKMEYTQKVRYERIHNNRDKRTV